MGGGSLSLGSAVVERSAGEHGICVENLFGTGIHVMTMHVEIILIEYGGDYYK